MSIRGASVKDIIFCIMYGVMVGQGVKCAWLCKRYYLGGKSEKDKKSLLIRGWICLALLVGVIVLGVQL